MPIPLSPSLFTSPPPRSALAALQAANVNLHLLSEKMALYLTKGVQQQQQILAANGRVSHEVVFSIEQLSVLQSATWSALIKAASDCMASAPPSPSNSIRKDQTTSSLHHSPSNTHTMHIYAQIQQRNQEFHTPLRHTQLTSSSPSSSSSTATPASSTKTGHHNNTSSSATKPSIDDTPTRRANESFTSSVNNTVQLSMNESSSQLNTPQPNPSLKLRPTPSESARKEQQQQQQQLQQQQLLRSPHSNATPITSSFSPSHSTASSSSPAASSLLVHSPLTPTPAASILRAPIANDLLATPVQLHSTPSALQGTPVSLSKMRAEMACMSLGTGATPIRSSTTTTATTSTSAPSQRLQMKQHAIRSLQHTPLPIHQQQQQQQQQREEEQKYETAASAMRSISSPAAAATASATVASSSTASSRRNSSTAPTIPPSDSESDAEELEQLIAFKMRVVDPTTTHLSHSVRTTPSSSFVASTFTQQSKLNSMPSLSASSPFHMRASSVNSTKYAASSPLMSDEAASVQFTSYSHATTIAAASHSSFSPMSSPDSTPLHHQRKSSSSSSSSSSARRSKYNSSDDEEDDDDQNQMQSNLLRTQLQQQQQQQQQYDDRLNAFASSYAKSIPSTPILQEYQNQRDRSYDRHRYSDKKPSRNAASSSEEHSASDTD